MGAKTEKLYGLADKAWQPIVGCREDLECAKRCWARRTVARIVECQRKDHPERAAFFQQVLTPNGQHWNGKVFLDKAHLTDPLRWRKPALIATGFHGDWALLPEADKDRMVAVMALCEQHRFMVLTKRPEYISEWAWRKHGYFTLEYKPGCSVNRFLPLDNVLLGVSITCQADADAHRAGNGRTRRDGMADARMARTRSGSGRLVGMGVFEAVGEWRRVGAGRAALRIRIGSALIGIGAWRIGFRLSSSSGVSGNQ